jgi:thymidylate kinase
MLLTRHPDMHYRTKFTRQPGTSLRTSVLNIVEAGRANVIESSLMFAALQTIAWFEEVLRSDHNRFVVTDRYSMSTLCYQLSDPNISRDDAHTILEVVSSVPEPDFTVIMIPGLDTCKQRVFSREITSSFDTDEQLQNRVHASYSRFLGVQEDNIVCCTTSEEAVEKVLAYMQKEDSIRTNG